jgi:hypothetical protein
MQSYDRPASDLLVQQWSTSGAVDAKRKLNYDHRKLNRKLTIRVIFMSITMPDGRLVPHAHSIFHGLFAATVALEEEGSFQLT